MTDRRPDRRRDLAATGAAARRALPAVAAGAPPDAPRCRQPRRARAEEALWAVWSRPAAAHGGSGWPQRLEQAALRGGDTGRAPTPTSTRSSRCSPRPAATTTATAGAAALAAFLAELAGQQIPADTLAEKGVRGPDRTPAHRPPGQGPAVVAGRRRRRAGGRVAGPAPPRSPCSAADRLDADRARREPAGPGQLLAEERRLFYVACTRARNGWS